MIPVGIRSQPMTLTRLQEAHAYRLKATLYQKWSTANPGEAARYERYVRDILAGLTPTAPTLATATGNMLAGLAGLALTAPSPPPPGDEPAPIKGQGYRQVDAYLFSTARDVDRLEKIWWQPEPRPDQARIMNGALRLSTYRKDNYPWVGLTTKPYDSMVGTWTPPYAIEVKYRWPGGRGSWPAIFPFSAANMKHFDGDKPTWTTPCAEFDLFEGEVMRPTHAPCVLHEDTSGRILGADRTNGMYDWGSPMPYRLDDGAVHTVLGELTATTARVWHDDRLVGQGPTFPSTVQPYGLILEQEVRRGEIDASTPDELWTEFLSVRVFAKP